MSLRENIMRTAVRSKKALIVSFHDVTPWTYEACAAFAEELMSVGVAAFTWLVVPLWHGRIRLTPNSPCAQWLRYRQSCGDDMVVHGLTHQGDGSKAAGAMESFRHLFIRRVYTAMESEFLDLEEPILRQRIQWAKCIVEQAGIYPVGFIAPAWVFPRHRYGILKEMGFRLTESYGRIHVLREGRSFRAPVVTASSRTPWRAFLSRWVVPVLGRLWGEAPVMRVAIHPADLKDLRIRLLMRAVAQRMRHGRDFHTLSSWAATVGL